MTKEEIARKVCGVRRQLVRSMNGVIAQRMRQSGVVYERNYGVDIPRLLCISTSLPHDKQLAEALWSLKIRETMLLAAMICPTDDFSVEDLRCWVKQIPTYEVAEMVSQKLFARLPYAVTQASTLIDGNGFEPVCGFLMASKLLPQMSDELAVRFKENAFARLNEPNLYPAVLVFFRCLVRHKKHLCNNLLDELCSLKETRSVALLCEEVKTQLEFF